MSYDTNIDSATNDVSAFVTVTIEGNTFKCQGDNVTPFGKQFKIKDIKKNLPMKVVLEKTDDGKGPYPKTTTFVYYRKKKKIITFYQADDENGDGEVQLIVNDSKPIVNGHLSLGLIQSDGDTIVIGELVVDD